MSRRKFDALTTDSSGFTSLAAVVEEFGLFIDSSV
jgi:hypothetical protein